MNVMTSPVLKVSVLASGSILLDSEAVSLDQLRKRIEAQKAARPVISITARQRSVSRRLKPCR